MTDIIKKDDQAKGVAPYETHESPISLLSKFFEDDHFDPFGMLSPSLFGTRRLGNVSSIFPKVDVSETQDEIKVIANIPGIDPDKLNIEVGEDYLSLSGKIEKEAKDEKGKVYRYEREYGEFRREFALPTRVKADSISAKAKNGVLTITLPKSEEEKKHKVRVEIES